MSTYRRQPVRPTLSPTNAPGCGLAGMHSITHGDAGILDELKHHTLPFYCSNKQYDVVKQKPAVDAEK